MFTEFCKKGMIFPALIVASAKASLRFWDFFTNSFSAYSSLENTLTTFWPDSISSLKPCRSATLAWALAKNFPVFITSFDRTGIIIASPTIMASVRLKFSLNITTIVPTNISKDLIIVGTVFAKAWDNTSVSFVNLLMISPCWLVSKKLTGRSWILAKSSFLMFLIDLSPTLTINLE